MMPTASAMVADILDTMRRGNGRKFIDWGPEQPERFVDPDTVPTRWFVRYANGCGSAFADNCVNSDGWCGAITEPMDRKALAAHLEDLDVGNVFRVLD